MEAAENRGKLPLGGFRLSHVTRGPWLQEKPRKDAARLERYPIFFERKVEAETLPNRP